ncbi:DUF1183-domain-containing protein [Gyrodon lividus]|nr:DUF1183-domain-containing protein [Gyrodon lividus]
MSRIALESIPALTFYKNSLTAARRTSPIAQLVCIGKPCALYQPEVVRCGNIGGSGIDVDWKCEADLPSSLRFGKVWVSCEGWSGPGDPYVMKGSCSLEYHLVQLPNSLREDTSEWSPFNLDMSGMVFMAVWLVVLALIAYSVIYSCLRRTYPPTGNTRRVPPPTYPGPGGDGGSGSGYFPGGFHPPPPYTKDPPSSDGQWRPGFFTGAAIGALGANLLNRSQSQPRAYDWERERPSSTRRRTASFYGDRDRGEGPSNLGSLRTSTGYGGSSSR